MRVLWLATAAAAVPKVPKTTVSSQVRFVFVAGLEGAGHHTMQDLAERCGGTCVADGGISRHLWIHGPEDKSTEGAFVYGDQTKKQIINHRSMTVAAFRRKAAKHGSGPPQLVFLNCIRGGTEAGPMMSYPWMAGKDKVLHRPDIRVLAMLAEEARVDLRVVVLQRNALDTLVSTTVHRNFGANKAGSSQSYEAAVLPAMAVVLAAQLRAIDGAFVECVDLAARGWLERDGLAALNTTRDFLLRGKTKGKQAKEDREPRRALAYTKDAKADEEIKSALRSSPFVEHLAAAMAALDEACDDARGFERGPRRV